MKKMVLVLILGLGCTQFFSCSKKGVELNFNAQLKKDVAAIDTYLASHNITAVKDTSGVRYIINMLGAGTKPNPSGNASVKFSSSVLGSTQVFYQTDGAVWALGDPNLIAGLKIVLPKIPKGTKFTLYIPSGLAYGNQDLNLVPANSNVVFDIELLDDDAQLIADVAAIDAYLDSIAADSIYTDPSGIRFRYLGEPGTGAYPTSAGSVTVTYTGKLLKSNQVFDNQASALMFALADVIQGWQIGLKLVHAGSHIILYIPSGLGYGPGTKTKGPVTIPSNSNLIFDIHLNSAN